MISILPEQLIVLHSEKGTLHLYWAEEEGIAYKTIQLQLKKVEALGLAHETTLLRCHRFFWVNPLRVENMEANARGVQLKMQGIPDAIPVSKTYQEVIKKWFA